VHRKLQEESRPFLSFDLHHELRTIAPSPFFAPVCPRFTASANQPRSKFSIFIACRADRLDL